MENLVGSPGPRDRTVKTPDGQIHEVPATWELLPPGDAAVTRQVKAGGATWTMQEKRGRKVFSRGIWAPADRIAAAASAVAAKRQSPAYQRKLEADRKRRESKHAAYAAEFEIAVREFLAFHSRFADLGAQVAAAIADHATPVGSGTVARTERIPLERRVEAAVIAWLRHQTTAYDRMQIKRIKGERREVRRELAQQSRQLLGRYRRGDDIPADQCPLRRALERTGGDPPEPEPSGPLTREQRDAAQKAKAERIRARLMGR